MQLQKSRLAADGGAIIIAGYTNAEYALIDGDVGDGNESAGVDLDGAVEDSCGAMVV